MLQLQYFIEKVKILGSITELSPINGLSFHIQSSHQPPGVCGQGQLFKGWVLKISGLGTTYSKVRALPQSASWFYATVFLNLSDLLIPNPPELIHVLDEQVFISLSVKKGKCPSVRSGDGDLSLSLKQKWVMTALALRTQAVVGAPHLLPGGNTFSYEHGVWLSPWPQSAKMWINTISKPFEKNFSGSWECQVIVL